MYEKINIQVIVLSKNIQACQVYINDLLLELTGNEIDSY